MDNNAYNGDGAPPPPPPPAPPPDQPQRLIPLRKSIKELGVTMIVIGILSIVISSVLVSLNDIFVTDYAGSGVWCGLFFIATGVCALNTFSREVAHMVVATTVTSVASMLLAMTMIAIISTSPTMRSNDDGYAGFKAAEGLLILLGVAEIVLTVSCMAACFVFLRQSRQQNQANAPIPEAAAPEDSSPFPTVQHKDTLKWLGIWQAVVGLASIVDNSITIALENYNAVSLTGVGIWCGIIFLATGILTFCAASTRSIRVIIGTLVMSILCALLMINMMVWPALYIPRASCGYSSCKKYSELATAYGLLVVLSLGELIMSLWCAIICYKAVCRPTCLLTCCIPQIVLHIQEGERELQAIQGGPRLAPVTTTASNYTIGTSIHVQIRLVVDHVQNEYEQIWHSGASNSPS